MNFQEFSTEYIKLYRFFYPKSSPNEEQLKEYFSFLKFMSFSIFQKICLIIKQREDNLPRNLVAYCKKAENDYDEIKGELARGSNPAPDPHVRVECAACQDTGFIGITVYVDPDTGQTARKVREVGDRGLEFAYRCTCSRGQKQAACIPPVTQAEVVQAAKLNGSEKLYQPPIRQLEYAEVPF